MGHCEFGVFAYQLNEARTKISHKFVPEDPIDKISFIGLGSGFAKTR